MDVRLQFKLLRAIQECLIDRVDGNKPVSVDIRILATSNRNLNEAVREGSFREYLLFRLNVVNLKLPPPCAIAPATSLRCPSTLSPNMPRPMACRRVFSLPTLVPPCSRLPGRETSASWKTLCIARCRSLQVMSSASMLSSCPMAWV